jgi:hypothetical protein
MALWKVSLDAVNNQAVTTIGGSVLRIPLDSTSPLTVGHIDHHDNDIKDIINQYHDVIASNTKKPSATSLVSFSIDTGDHRPIYTPPLQFHPQL